MRETNKDDLKKTCRSEKDSRIQARIPAVHTVRVRKKGICETATDLMQSERWVDDWFKLYDEEGLDSFRDLPWPRLERRTSATGSGRRIERMRCDSQRYGGTAKNLRSKFQV